MPKFRIVANRVRRDIVCYEGDLPIVPTEAEAAEMIDTFGLSEEPSIHKGLKLVCETFHPYGYEVFLDYVERIEEDTDAVSVEVSDLGHRELSEGL